jgi:hypothetical protein
MPPLFSIGKYADTGLGLKNLLLYLKMPCCRVCPTTIIINGFCTALFIILSPAEGGALYYHRAKNRFNEIHRGAPFLRLVGIKNRLAVAS